MSAQAQPDPWLDRLGGDAREAAVAELRHLILRGLAKAMRGRPGVDDAFLEDVTQDAVLKILDALPTFGGRARFTTWAMAIAVRAALTELRRRRWRDVSLDAMSAEGELTPERAIDPSLGPEKRHAQQGVFDALRRLIDTSLTDRQRTAIQAEMAGLPMEEIARQLGSNRNAVYKLTHDARRKLQEGLEASGLTREVIFEAFSS